MSTQSALLIAELAKLNPSSVVELFVLDASSSGGGVLYFYNGIKEAPKPELPNAPIMFQGRAYNPMPIQVSGFEFRAKGELPLPKIKFSNVFGLFTSLVLLYDDLVDAVLTRKRTLRKFLDDGTDPDPTAEFPEDIFYVDRKTIENKQIVEFELGSSIDVDGVSLPRRIVTSNLCSVGYRSAECSFADNRFVTVGNGDFYPLGLPLSRYRGAHSLALNYSVGDAVSTFISDTEESFYYALTAHTGMPLTNATHWQRSQHYRGQWSESVLYYINDVVYVFGRNGDKQYFLLNVATARGANTEPPNLNYWLADQCAKTLRACKQHHDPLNLNKPLPYGGFPGTSRSLLA